MLENKDKGNEAKPRIVTIFTDEEQEDYACPLYCEN
jgi:hypothetical protein